VLANISRSRYYTPQYGRNGTVHADFIAGEGSQSSPACVVRAVGLVDYRWSLTRISSVAIAMQPMH